MPRRNQNRQPKRKGGSGARPQHDDSDDRGGMGVYGGMRIAAGPAGSAADEFTMRMVPGSKATKTYRCPGCDHEVLPGVPHVVEWPTDDFGGAENRRHWHTGCWSGRATRGLTRRWS